MVLVPCTVTGRSHVLTCSLKVPASTSVADIHNKTSSCTSCLQQVALEQEAERAARAQANAEAEAHRRARHQAAVEEEERRRHQAQVKVEAVEHRVVSQSAAQCAGCANEAGMQPVPLHMAAHDSAAISQHSSCIMRWLHLGMPSSPHMLIPSCAE